MTTDFGCFCFSVVLIENKTKRGAEVIDFKIHPSVFVPTFEINFGHDFLRWPGSSSHI